MSALAAIRRATVALTVAAVLLIGRASSGDDLAGPLQAIYHPPAGAAATGLPFASSRVRLNPAVFALASL